MKHTIRGIIRIIFFLSVSVFAVGYSLGYQINWEAKTIQQTGIIYLDTREANIHPDITINGVNKGKDFAYREHHIFPANYTIVVSKDGYQKWEKTVRVDANKVVSFPYILIIKEKPNEVELTSAMQKNFVPKRILVDQSMEIKSGNELWLSGKYITRYGNDIVQAQWYQEKDSQAHIVMQLDDQLYLLDADGSNQQFMADLKDESPALFDFYDNGRILLIQESGSVKAFELYEK